MKSVAYSLVIDGVCVAIGSKSAMHSQRKIKGGRVWFTVAGMKLGQVVEPDKV